MHRSLKPFISILIGSFFIALSTNWFLVPGKIIGGGVSGIAMVVGYYFNWNISLLFFLFNIPLIIWGWSVMGFTFMKLTIISILSTSVFLLVIPIHLSPLLPNPDLSLAAIFGGVLAGIGVGICLRVGGSSGGFDIIGAIFTHKHDVPIGNLLLALNGIVLLLFAWTSTWNFVFWSILSEYTAVKLIEYLHTRYEKVTVFIVSKNHESLISQLLLLKRGVTMMHAIGAYSQRSQFLLMTVTTRYELPYLKGIIKSVDSHAFINIVNTSEVLGSFRKITNK